MSIDLTFPMLTLDAILGQPQAISWLKSAYESNRLPHGLLFAGPHGVGKQTTAFALATLFLCEKPKAVKPCGKCDSCVAMAAESHPDYHRVYRALIREEKKDAVAKDLAVDVIRKHLVEPANRTSLLGVGKVFVVEEADTMNSQAQNSLLKTLEEPQGRTLIILLTESPGSLLSTIRSRTQLVRFLPLPQELIIRELTRRGISNQDASDAAELTDGSLGAALNWIEDDILRFARVLRERVHAMTSGQIPSDLQEILKESADHYAAKQLTHDPKASKDRMTREGLILSLRIAANELRKALPHKEGEDAERLCQAIESLERTASFIDENVNVSLALQDITIKLGRELSAT